MVTVAYGNIITITVINCKVITITVAYGKMMAVVVAYGKVMTLRVAYPNHFTVPQKINANKRFLGCITTPNALTVHILSIIVFSYIIS